MITSWTNLATLGMPLRAYFSHPIRGTKGAASTDADIQENIGRATRVVADLRQKFGKGVQIYFPGEQDEFVITAYNKEYITENQILDVDCEIISKRDCLLIWTWEEEISGGMQIEFDFANKRNIPTMWIITEPLYEHEFDVGDTILNYNYLCERIGGLLESNGRLRLGW